MPSRSLIKEGIVDCPNSDGQARKRFFVVFNDMMIMAKIDGDKYKMMHMISYDKASVSSDETVTKIDISVDNKKLAEISFDSSKTGTESGASWLKALQQAISEFTAQKTRINDAKTRNTEPGAPSPTAASPGGKSPSSSTALAKKISETSTANHNDGENNRKLFRVSETTATEKSSNPGMLLPPILLEDNSNFALEEILAKTISAPER